MLAERVTTGFWPLWSIVILVLAALMLGLQDMLSLRAFWIIAALAGAAALWALLRGLMQFRWPRRDEAIGRLDATMPGRPIQAMLDDQVIGAGDAASRAVWQAHQKRMQARANERRNGNPRSSKHLTIDASVVSAFTEGERVFHQKYGYGVIMEVDNDKLGISFDKAGDKKVMANFVVAADKAGDVPF